MYSLWQTRNEKAVEKMRVGFEALFTGGMGEVIKIATDVVRAEKDELSRSKSLQI